MSEKVFFQREKYNELTECGICCNTLTDPAVLPCLHLFCRTPCLSEWSKRKAICPTCRAPFEPSQIKTFHCLANFMNEVNQESSSNCPDCNSTSVILENCEHCSKEICKTCAGKHMLALKQEVSEMCEKLTSVTAPKLEELNVKIVTLMSESSAAKEKLANELRQVHDTLVTQIYSLRDQSIDILNNIEKSSQPQGEDGLHEIDSLLTRIDSVCTQSTNIVEEKDIQKLVQLDSDITNLQMDIEAFQAKDELRQMNIDQNLTSFRNIKINQAYKNIAAQIEDTDMLKKTGF